MGRAYNVNISASGVGVDPIPISVSGSTLLTCDAKLQVAYDPTDFNSNQFSVFNGTLSNVPLMRFAPNTILWLRQDPNDVGLPAVDLFVLTQIGEGAY